MNAFKRLIKLAPLWALFLIAIVFRGWYSNQTVAFSQDQARDVYLMKTWSQDGQWLVPYGAKTSVGAFYVPPAYYQLQLVVSHLTNNQVRAMQWVVVALESLTPVILFLILRELVDSKWALAIGFAYVFSPLATTFGTVAWNPSLIPLVSTAALWAWLRYGWHHKPWGITLAVFLSSIVFHLHFQAAILVPFGLLMAAYSLKKDGLSIIKYWLAGVGLAVLPLLPYIGAELKSDWINTRHIFDFYLGEHSQYYDRVSKPAYVLTFWPSFIERVLFGTQTKWFWLGRLIFGGGLIGIVITALRHPRWRWILGYVVLLIISLRFYKGDKLDYYLSLAFIVPSLLLASWLKYGKLLALAALVFVLFIAGRHYGRTSYTNQLAVAKATAYEIVRQLDEVSGQQQAVLLVHDTSKPNWYFASLALFTEYEYAEDSRLLVEICQPDQPCINLSSVCSQDRATTYSGLAQTNNQEILKSVLLPDGNQLYVSLLEQPVTARYAPAAADSDLLFGR